MLFSEDSGRDPVGVSLARRGLSPLWAVRGAAAGERRRRTAAATAVPNDLSGADRRRILLEGDYL